VPDPRNPRGITAAPSPDLGIVVDRAAEVPVGVQIAWAIRARVCDGTLTPGDQLPGVRDLAEAAGVNVNTVRSVYQRLETEGVTSSEHGRGTFVATGAPHSAALGRLAAVTAREARARGIDPRDLASALYVQAGDPDLTDDPDPERRRTLRAQIAALELLIGELGEKTSARSPSAPAIDGPRLLGASDLEAARDELVRTLAAIQTAREESAASDPAQAAAAPRQRSPAASGGAARRRTKQDTGLGRPATANG
jgi:DNA-binding transcriptional regulator YhcF (GntR family)